MIIFTKFLVVSLYRRKKSMAAKGKSSRVSWREMSRMRTTVNQSKERTGRARQARVPETRVRTTMM